MKNFLQLTFLFLLLCRISFGQSALQNEINTFATKTGAVATIDKATNSISFLRFPASQALKVNGITSNDKALTFMAQNAGIFGVKSGIDNFSVLRQQRDAYGLEHVVLQHYVNNVPVYDGLLKFHYNKAQDLTSLNGNFVQVDKLNTTPTVTIAEAEALAMKMVESQKMKEFNSLAPIPLIVNKSTLYVFQKGLAQGYNGPKHLVYEVEVRNNKDIREFLFIDAHTKELVEQFTGMHAALNRKLYQPSYSAAFPAVNLLWKEGDTFPGTLDQWQRSEIESAGQMYNLIKNAFGRISYDGADATMITTNNNPSINCPNANWNGVSANYCTNVAADDVVAHEWGHAYTEYTSGLIYAWQSGALNEAYSDIWGETVDQLNGYFDSGEGTAMRATTGDDCPAVAVTTRWKVGEQATAFGGSIRDMYNPNCNNDPGRVLDPKYYCTTPPLTSSNDQGGVHTNSGVINHSYALLVDGGTYNGQSITGIGLTKAAHIYWYAQANFMTKTTDFAAQADMLEAAAQALMDGSINLKVLSTGDADPGLSGLVITTNDLLQLQKVLLAVELRMDNNCASAPMFQPVPVICAGGSPEKAIFYADFEAGLGDWTVSNTGSNGTWTPRNWVLQPHAPKGRAGQVVYGINSNKGDCATNLQNGVISLLSPVITIPTSANGALNLAFDHSVSIEEGWDGGIVNYKIGSGAWTQIPKSAFTANGYNSYTNFSGSNNPLKGKDAFSGSDVGSASGSWGQSRIDLSALGILPNDIVQFRWDLGSDGCGGWDGWYIDDVRVYSCDGPGVQFVSESTIVNEAEATNAGPSPNACLPYVEKIIKVKINKAPSAPVTITFTAPTGTATMGETADYTFSPLTFDLQAGHLSQDVTFRIYNDAYVEGNETVVLNYTMSGGDGFPESFNQTHTITINDNDVIPGLDSKTPLYADFNDGLIPSGWTYGGTTGTYPQEWAVFTGSGYLDESGVPFLWASSDARGPGLHTFQIETAPFNTLGMTNLNISFLQYFRIYPGGDPVNATVEVWDGSAWQIVLTQTRASGDIGAFNGGAVTTNIPIPVAYANAAMKLRFSYTANYDYWWALDNIKVTGLYPKQIESAVTSVPDQQYLGPLGKAYFYDPVTKDLLAAVENLTPHDYGCTSVSIDRAGDGSATWVGAYTITKKTYLITPSNPNPAGKYKITIYYKDTELGAFISSIQSMGKSEGGITTGNLATSSFAEVERHDAFNTDWSYTAEFDSGFSGFGLSDAPPVGALPVTLVKFEGKNIEKGNMLEWSTTAEVNNDYFILERAADAKRFKEIARVAGIGTSSITSNYNFLDSKFSTGLNYYRLKQVDRDGTFAYSKMVVIESNTLRALKYYPNPVQTILSIDLPEATLEAFNMEIVNGTGQVVMKLGEVSASNGVFKQDVSKLVPGVYQVLISNALASYSFKVVKL